MSQNESVASSAEALTPPPPGFTSPFNSVEQWLAYICDNDQPQKSIEEYRFDLYEAPGDNMLSLTGYNHTVEEGMPVSRIDFVPAKHPFFALPKDVYKNLSQEQTKNIVFKELNEFIASQKFNDSFLSKAFYINTSFAGEIWSK
ncbi:MAG TPA: hypothetical protein VD993_00155 [Chitinophagaceae bacterium]|nr:hypothetical protein [Chitinophagaceae bacterium]